MTAPESLLSQAQEALTHWRQTRKSRGKVPEEIWNLVLPLKGHFPISYIRDRLGLNYEGLKKRFSEKKPLNLQKKQSLSPSHDFIELPSIQQNTAHVCVVDFKREGASIELKGYNPQELSCILNGLLGGRP